MGVWNKVPMVRLLIPWLIGIVLAVYMDVFYPAFSFLLLLLLLLGVIWMKKRIASKILFKWEWGFGIGVLLLFLLLSYTNTWFKDDAHRACYFADELESDSVVFGVRVIAVPQLREKVVKLEGEVLWLKQGEDCPSVNGKLLMYIEKDSNSKKLALSDELVFCAPLRKVQPPKNPGEFDYYTYLKRKAIHYQVYVKRDKWRWEHRSVPYARGRFFYDCRMGLFECFMKEQLTAEKREVLGALVLGYRTICQSTTCRL